MAQYSRSQFGSTADRRKLKAAFYAHPCDRASDELDALEVAGVLGEEAEDQPGEDVVQLFPACVGVTIEVGLGAVRRTTGSTGR